ncbi:MAG: Smr/MutS family protein [Thermodesulfobacteriota bacterium]|jgi:DNA-nicking Smr family endonuclease|nr:MAG: Smr/MutS family protein [Thermodesulfobacteriota bacterium]
MKSNKPSLILRSFNGLKVIKKKCPVSLTSTPPAKAKNNVEHFQNPESEQGLFEEAMADVTPLARDADNEKKLIIKEPAAPVTVSDDPTAEVISRLTNLVEKGEGFLVSQTPEYMEGIGYNVKPEIAERLHRGDFALDAHLDLHGFNVEKAKEVFDFFLKEAIRTGKKSVLIVHGRGLSSPEEPVLKTKVREWLTRGFWRKWILAFTSARPCDGGAGATYVLLRERPYAKRLGKTRND